MAEDQPTITRKTRFVCISDTHNGSPNGSFKLPKGDVLIHAGDLTNQGSYSELQKTIRWIEEADFETKIVVAGNHDITLDTDFYVQYGLYFHNQNPQQPSECQRLLEESPSILWLKHEEATVNLVCPSGPRTTFKIFGSPYSPAHDMWAFGYKSEEAKHTWNHIPLDVDIVVTHTPPKYHCDEKKNRRAVGCEALRQALWRIRPRLAICGHVHEGRGAERVRWDLGASNIKYKESSVAYWEDTGKDNKKISVIDLTKKGRDPLDNDGSVGDWIADDDVYSSLVFSPSQNSLTESRVRSRPGSRNAEDLTSTQSPQGSTSGSRTISRSSPKSSPRTLKTSSVIPSPRSATEESIPESRPNPSSGLNFVSNDDLAAPAGLISQACWGQGGVPPSKRCDLEALSGRMGRRETCIVNAAMMASSWPHSAGGGKKFNKPIVIDIDLPVWEKL